MNAVIIDDDPTIRHLLGRVLLARGYEVTSYSSPKECPLYADASCPCRVNAACPDLIISDYDMPDVNGIEFVAHLKKKKCKCNNIAMMSGSWTEQDLQQELPPEVHVFAKPFHFNRLSAWLDKITAQGGGVALNTNGRRHVRYPCELPLVACFASSGLRETVQAVARNISKGGMLVECSKLLSPTTSFQVAFTVPDWMCLLNNTDRKVVMTAQVRHVTDAARTYGLQFVEPLR
jgi:CheY-like chemotaxis protein